MKKLWSGLAFLAFTVLIFLYATGALFPEERVAPGKAPEPPGLAEPSRTAEAERAEVEIFEEAVGTVESRVRVTVAAQVTARVLTVAADAGTRVRKGDTLVTLDDRELAARLAQSRQALAAAEAARGRAVQNRKRGEARLSRTRSGFDRIQRLFKGGAATDEQVEAAESEFLQAQAGVEDAAAAITAAEAGIQQAKQVVTEAEVAFGHARILAPVDGVVSERSVEAGDLSWPGRTLYVILDPTSVRLEAQVREGLISRVLEGARLPIEIPAAGARIEGTVAELIPSADPLSRTFRVRVDFDPVPGVHPGMFGRLRLPVGRRTVVRVPVGAVVLVGQLETVVLKGENGRWGRRLITTGKLLEEDSIEVLSGLRGGETVGYREAPK